MFIKNKNLKYRSIKSRQCPFNINLYIMWLKRKWLYLQSTKCWFNSIQNTSKFTCNWSFYFYHGFLPPQYGSTLIDNSKCNFFIHPTFFNQVVLQNINPGYPIHIKYFFRCQPMSWRKRDSCVFLNEHKISNNILTQKLIGFR